MARRLSSFKPPAIAAALLVLAAAPASAAAAGSNRDGVRLVPIAAVAEPIAVATPPTDRHRLFVVERAGKVRLIRNGKLLARAFLNLSPRVGSGGERGMLSIAFSPGYRTDGLMYVCFNAIDGDIRVEEYRRSAKNADVADVYSRRTIIVIAHPNHNHNSGELQFGPDGLLYLGTGDGGSSGDPYKHGQDLGSSLGKILRIDPRRDQPLVPANNPFVSLMGAQPTVFAYGLRNPWRFSFDRVTGAFTVADVGQNEVEEFDYVKPGHLKGSNFGWSKCEGTHAFPPAGHPRAPCTLKHMVIPVIQHPHNTEYCAGIGGYIVRDRSLTGLYGRYVYGDFCRPALRSARVSGSARYRDDRAIGLSVVALSAFGEGPGGCLYVTSLAGGVVSRLAPAGGGDRVTCPGGKAHAIANPPVDRTAPVLTVGAQAQPALQTGFFGVDAQCDERCTLTATARLVGTGTATVLLHTRRRTLPGGLPGRIGFALSHERRDHLVALRHVNATVTIRATDAAGNVRIRILRVRLTSDTEN